MQQRTSLLLDLFPRDGFYFARLHIMTAASYLLLPGCIHILINGCVQTGDQVPSQLCSFVLGQRQSLLQQFVGFLSYQKIILSAATWLSYFPTTIFPFSSLTTYAHGNFAS
jgi:hypothetical protein